MNEYQRKNRGRFACQLISLMLERNGYDVADGGQLPFNRSSHQPDLVAVRQLPGKPQQVLNIELKWIRSEDQLRSTLATMSNHLVGPWVYAIVQGSGKNIYVSSALKPELLYDSNEVNVQTLADLGIEPPSSFRPDVLNLDEIFNAPNVIVDMDVIIDISASTSYKKITES